jgi:sRNA-binding regulator protein Hfq
MRKLRWILITTVLAGLWIATAPVLAQGGSISYGQSVGGYIANGGIDTWSFYGSAGDVISITMYADGGSNLNTYLWLYDSSGTQVTWNDDYYGTDAAVLGFTLPYSDTFSIQASGAGEGGYTLWLTLEAMGAISNPAQPTSPGASSAGALPISYGETINGTITTAESYKDYTFNGSQGDQVTITAISQDGVFDPYLTLYDGQGNFLVADDDSYVAPNAQIILSLPSTDAYVIRVQAYNNITTGSYSLTLSNSAMGALPPPPGPPATSAATTAIRYGDSLNGEIPASAPDVLEVYTFAGSQGDQVTITVSSQIQNFDPYLVLLNSGGSQVAYDDDSYGNLNPSINLALPYDDTYTIYVGAVRQASSGKFIISLSKSAQAAPPANPPGSTATAIGYGDTLTGSLPPNAPGALVPYTFTGTQGDQVTITVVSQVQSLDPYVILLDSNGSQVAYDDDSYGNFNPLISLVLPATGSYTIYVGATNQGASGSFTISLTGSTLGAPPAVPGPVGAEAEMLPEAAIGNLLPGFGVQGGMVAFQPPQANVPPANQQFWMNYGDAVDAEFVSGTATDKWMFNGNRGDTVTISMVAQTQGVDPRLALLDPDGNVAAQDDDSLGNFNAQINSFTLTATGTYVIEARTANNFPGKYTIQLWGTPGSAAGGTITYFQTVPNVCCAGTTVADEHTWQFDAKQGEILSITMTADSTDMVPWLYLLRFDGVVMAENNNPVGSQTIIINFTVPYDMRMMIMPRARAGRGTYTLRLDNTGIAGDTQGGLIDYSQTVVDQVSATNTRDQWILYANAGDRILIMMYFLDDQMDPFLTLTDYAGDKTLAQNDDIDSSNRNAQITYTVTETGNYIINATASNSTSYGRYMLVLHLYNQ